MIGAPRPRLDGKDGRWLALAIAALMGISGVVPMVSLHPSSPTGLRPSLLAGVTTAVDTPLPTSRSSPAPPAPPAPLSVQYTLDTNNDSLVRGDFLPQSLDDPDYAAFDPADSQLFVSNDNGLGVVDPSTMQVEREFTNLCPGPVAYDTVHNVLLVSGNGYVDVVDPQNGVVNASIKAGDAECGPEAFLAFVPYEDVVVVGGVYESSADVVNISQGSVSSTISIGDSFALSGLYDPVNQYVYIGEHDNNEVLVVDTSNWTTIKTVSLNAYSLFFYGLGVNTATGNVYASTLFNGYSDDIVEISGKNGSILASKGIGEFTSSSVYDNSTGDVYVADSEKKSIYVLNANNLSYVETISIPTVPSYVYYQWWLVDVPALNAILVPEQSQGNLAFVSTTNGTVFANLVAPQALGPVTYDPSNGCYIVDDSTAPDLMFVNATDWSIVLTVPLNLTSIRSISFDAGQNQIWVPGYGGIEVLNASTGSELAFFPDGSNPTGSAVDSRDGRVFVTQYGSDSVLAYDATNLSAPPVPVPIGEATISAAYAPGPNQVFVSNSALSNVTVINASADSEYGSIRTGGGPWPVWYDAGDAQIFTGNEASNNVTEIDPATDSVVRAIGVPYVAQFASNGSSGAPLYATNESNDVMSIDPSAGTWSNLSVGSETYGIAVGPNGSLGVGDYSNGGFYLVAASAPTLLSNVSLLASPFELPEGTNLTLTATASGGSGPLTFGYFGLPTGCASADLSRLTCQPTVSGFFTVRLTVHDSAGEFDNATARVWIEPSYALWFNETGLPAGTPWWLNASDGNSWSTSGGSIQIVEINGSYAFSFATANYTYAGGSLQVTVNGAQRALAAHFYRDWFQITFQEAGLPSGVAWTVRLAGHTASAPAGVSVGLYAPNGTSRYSISSSNTSWAASGGQVAVNGASFTVDVNFSLFRYPISFTASGLPSGTVWWLNISGEALMKSIYDLAAALLPNGTRSFTGQAASGNWSEVRGNVSVDGASTSASLRFQLINWSFFVKAVGIPNGLPWWFNVTGRPAVESTAPASQIALPNGTYEYDVGVAGPYAPNSTLPDHFVVAGALTSSFEIDFHSAIGTLWPEVSGFTASPNPVAEQALVTVTVSVEGGTVPYAYAYSGAPSGCSSAHTDAFSCQPTENGTFDLHVVVTDHLGRSASANLTLVVQPQPSTTKPNTPVTQKNSSVAPSSDTWAFALLGIVALVAATGIVLALRRRGQGGGGSASSLRPSSEREDPGGEAPPS